MPQATKGDTVRIHYTGTLDTGRVFSTTHGREPIVVRLGEGRVIPVVEQAILGMRPGESRSLHVVSDDAYGPWKDERVLRVRRDDLPGELDAALGAQVQLLQQAQPPLLATITAATDQELTLDANHPFAGHDLTLEISLLEILRDVD